MSNLSTAIYFLLSSLTGIIEVGVVIYAIKQGYSVVQVLILVLAYQVGCFFPTNIKLKKPVLILFECVAFTLAMICSIFSSFWMLMFAVLFISPCLQVARCIQKSSISTGVKRIFRILGFMLSPLFSPILLTVIISIIWAITVLNKSHDENKLDFKIVSLPYLIMIVHQMHYFSYAYIVLVIANALDTFGGYLTALIFVLGWITYTSAQYIFRGNNYFAYLVGGHLFLVVLLVAMAITGSETVKIVLWVLTGFGGGTVFCIKELFKEHGKYNEHLLDSSENYGHILGVVCSIIIYSIFSNIDAPIVFASVCATFTVFFASYFRISEHGGAKQAMIKVNEVNVNSYLTASKLPDADYVINPYIGCTHKCIYCYAEFMKRFTNHVDDEWGDFLDIKLSNTPIKTEKLAGASVLFGSVTDAYNPYEKKYEITRKILQEFIGANAKVEILTKSDLVTRDIDLLKMIPDIRVGISLNSLDDSFCKKTEPFASSIYKRINAMKHLHEEGINTYLFMSPIFPGITQFVEIVEKVKPYTDAFYFENLNLRGAYLPRVLNFIADNFPEHVELYNRIYKKKENDFWEKLSDSINTYCSSNGFDYKLYFYHEKIKKGGKK